MISLQIRANLLSGEPVPAWLQGGTYGEPDPALALDGLMVKAASLRSKSILVMNQATREPVPTLRYEEALNTVLAEAQLLDSLFAQWAEDMPQNWKFITHRSPDYDGGKLSPGNHHLFYDHLFHSYTTRGHAVVWNRYRAVRLLINSIQMELLFQVTQYRPENLSTAYLDQSTACQETINRLITDLCRSIPFFYLLDAGFGHRRRDTNPATELAVLKNSVSSQSLPIMMAVLLAWPITIAVGIECVPLEQMKWLKCRLQAISQRVGSPRLRVTLEK